MGDSSAGNQLFKASADAMLTVAEKAPLTAQRKLRSDLDSKLPKPCMHACIHLVYMFIYFWVLIDSMQLNMRDSTRTCILLLWLVNIVKSIRPVN